MSSWNVGRRLSRWWRSLRRLPPPPAPNEDRKQEQEQRTRRLEADYAAMTRRVEGIRRYEERRWQQERGGQ